MALFVYVTCASPDEAERIGRALLDERLAACVNILPSPSVPSTCGRDNAKRQRKPYLSPKPWKTASTR